MPGGNPHEAHYYQKKGGCAGDVSIGAGCEIIPRVFIASSFELHPFQDLSKFMLSSGLQYKKSPRAPDFIAREIKGTWTLKRGQEGIRI